MRNNKINNVQFANFREWKNGNTWVFKPHNSFYNAA